MTEVVAQDWAEGSYLPEVAGAWPVLAHVLSLNPPGWALEFGVAQGASTTMIAKTMPVVGFDSFQGLPEDWGGYPKGFFACRPPTIPNVHLVIGLFADTLPTFSFPEQIGLVHVDVDLYTSTVTVLKHVGPHLRPGCYVVFDEWFGHDEHEPRAWREFAARTGITWRAVARSDQPWAIQIINNPILGQSETV